MLDLGRGLVPRLARRFAGRFGRRSCGFELHLISGERRFFVSGEWAFGHLLQRVHEVQRGAVLLPSCGGDELRTDVDGEQPVLLEPAAYPSELSKANLASHHLGEVLVQLHIKV